MESKAQLNKKARLERVRLASKKISDRLAFIKNLELGTIVLSAVMVFMLLFLLSDGLEFNLTPINPISWGLLIIFKTVISAIVVNFGMREVVKIFTRGEEVNLQWGKVSAVIGIIVAVIYLITKLI